MKIFDKDFNVELISFEDKSTKGDTYRKVIFKADGEIYHYTYTGGGPMALSSVFKDTGEEVYSPWKHIPNGSYYEEIGRKLSIQQQSNAMDRVIYKIGALQILALCVSCGIGMVLTANKIYWQQIFIIPLHVVFVLTIIKLNNKWCEKIEAI